MTPTTTIAITVLIAATAWALALPSGRRRAWVIGAVVLGWAGLVLGRRWRARVALPAELAAKRAEMNDAKARARRLRQHESASLRASAAHRAEADRWRAKLERAEHETQAARDRVASPMADDLRARRFLRRWRDRHR